MVSLYRKCGFACCFGFAYCCINMCVLDHRNRTSKVANLALRAAQVEEASSTADAHKESKEVAAASKAKSRKPRAKQTPADQQAVVGSQNVAPDTSTSPAIAATTTNVTAIAETLLQGKAITLRSIPNREDATYEAIKSFAMLGRKVGSKGRTLL